MNAVGVEGAARPSADEAGASRGDAGGRPTFGPTVALTVTLALGCFLAVMSLVLLIVHPSLVTGLGPLAQFVNQQNQSAKALLYVIAFVVILPVWLAWVPRLVDRIAEGANGPALNLLAAIVAGTLAVSIILVKVSGSLPWGDGLGVLLVAVASWSLLTAGALARALRPAPWPPLLRLASGAGTAWFAAGVAVLGVLLCVTHVGSLSPIGLLASATGALGVLAARGRVRLPSLPRAAGAGVEVLVAVIVLLAIPDVVVFHASSAIPNIYFPPGVIQFQQDWILGPTNQLLAGGALLVDDPSSQYGVGLVYFLGGWFHIAPIGYGTFGLLDGILTALFYLAGYWLLRIAGVTRLLAALAIAVAVAVLLYNLPYSVGALPEQGPLRFGLPILVVLALVAEARWPTRACVARSAALLALAVASIWALEAFAYTAFTFVAMTVLAAWRQPPETRTLWLLRALALAVAAFLCAHLVLAVATLAFTGELPNWNQYLAYVRALVLGGREGSITYGFAPWSPGLAVGAACLTSAAVIALLARRASAIARREHVRLAALTGTTAYAIACLSYNDNRSSTYLLLYTTLPLLITGALWLSWLLSSGTIARPLRAGGLAFTLAVVVLLLAAAWPAVGTHFSRSALAHAYAGGGLRAAVVRLWRPPPIDPRAPAGQRLVREYIPDKHPLILLWSSPDLAIEILMRSGRASPLFVGDPSMDSYVPAVWGSTLARQLAQLRDGQRLLVDTAALAVIGKVRGQSSSSLLADQVPGHNAELEWILHRIDQRFRLRLISADRQGLVVAELVRR